MQGQSEVADQSSGKEGASAGDVTVGHLRMVAALLPSHVPEGHMVRAWLDTWAGLGQVVDAMHQIGYNARLSRSPFAWTADFTRSEVSQLPMRFGWNHDATPWRAVQRAALETLRREQGP